MNLTALFIQGSLYGITGVFVGLVSGLMGIGGGIVMVPALLFIFHRFAEFPQTLLMPMAAGTSLAVILFTSQSAIRSHARRGNILWNIVHRLWPGIVLGTIIGVILNEQLPTRWLKIVLGLFLLFVATKTLIDLQKKPILFYRFPAPWLNRLISFLIGCNAGLLGIGGGILVISYLDYCGVEVKKIAPISAWCTMVVAAVGTLMFIITGLGTADLPAYTTGFIYWPAVLCVAIPSSFFASLGAKLIYILPTKQLKYGFISLLTLTALSLFINH